MIFGNRTSWISESHPHRDIRLSASNPDFFGNRIHHWDWNNRHGPDLVEYLANAQYFFQNIQDTYQVSFDPSSYRRQSESIALVLDKSNPFVASASTDIKGNINNLAQIKLSTGLLLAVEDASHTLLADTESNIGHNERRGMPDDYTINKINDFKMFDSCRYIDYYPIIDYIKKYPEIEIYPEYSFLLFKFLSISPYRQYMADIISTTSLLWILGHEDAHNYLGHIKYYQNKDLGLSSNESLYSEFYPNSSDQERPRIRVAAEIQADTNACARIVDHLVDKEFIDIFPVLKKFHKSMHEQYSEFFTNTEILTASLVRLCTFSAILAVSIFERNVIRKNITTDFYPSYLERVQNIIMTTIFRTNVSILNNPRFQLTTLSNKSIVALVVLIVNDLRDICRNIFYDQRIIFDAKIINNESIKNIKKIIHDPYFATDLSDSIIWAQFMDSNYEFYSSPFNSMFYDFLCSRQKDLEIWNREFPEFRLLANPNRTDKVFNSLDIDKKAELSLKRRLRV